MNSRKTTPPCDRTAVPAQQSIFCDIHTLTTLTIQSSEWSLLLCMTKNKGIHRQMQRQRKNTVLEASINQKTDNVRIRKWPSGNHHVITISSQNHHFMLRFDENQGTCIISKDLIRTHNTLTIRKGRTVIFQQLHLVDNTLAK